MKWLETGRVLSYPHGGVMESAEGFIMQNQLKRADLWKRFVNVYRTGTDSDNGGWRGEYFGKMMRGACFTYAYTKDPELYRILTGAMEDMLSAQRPDGAFSSYRIGQDMHSWDMWCRKYVLLAFYYFTLICDDNGLTERIRAAALEHIDAILERVGPEEEGKIPVTKTSVAWRGLNSSSILEPVMLWYGLTGEKKLLRFAEHIVSCGGIDGDNIFELARRNEIDPYTYPVTKAYEMISCMEGLLEYAIVTNNEGYKQAVHDFGKRVLTSDFTVIGSGGMTHELFDHSFFRQSSMGVCEIAQETCVTVTMMKFFARLYAEFGDPEFADALERSFFNAYLGALNTEKQVEPRLKKMGGNIIPEFLPFDSYSPLTLGRRGRQIGGFMVFPEGNYYGCCACIGSLGAAVTGLSSVRCQEDNGKCELFIDHLIPGEALLDLPEGRFGFRIETDYPYIGKADIIITLPVGENGCSGADCPAEPRPETVINVRIPGWCRNYRVAINGSAKELKQEKGHVSLRGSFKDGDVISVEFEIRPEIERPVIYGSETVAGEIREQDPRAKERICVKYGTLVLTPELEETAEGFDAPLPAGAFDEAALSRCNIRPGTVDRLPKASERALTAVFKDKDGREATLFDYSSCGKKWDGRPIGPWFRIR